MGGRLNDHGKNKKEIPTNIEPQFIRYLKIPYLTLYDKGYTSLGGTEDTHPNPQLKKENSAEGFRPAYELLEDEEERLGRDA